MSAATSPISRSFSIVRPKIMTSGYRRACAGSAARPRRLADGRTAMGEQSASQRFVDEATAEPEHIARARAHALELGATPLSAALGAQVAVLAAASQALNIVEIGTGAGVSGLWLLHGSP